MNPVPYEPLFEKLAERGYIWEAANDMVTPTQRWAPDQFPSRSPGKIDWFFTRGLDVLAAKTVPAVNALGRPLADHEPLVVTIKPEA
jgi:endonuclease/exonuclease/phosphatase family metal-dependent hydrolase